MKPLYLDNHLLAVVKPAGIPTQPDFHEEMRAFIKREFNKPGNVFLEPAHRLDKPVSGIVLFARTSKALSRLNEQIRSRKIKKVYVARIEGVLTEPGMLMHCLLHGDHRAIVSPSGKQAILHYTPLSIDRETTLVEIELITGRYHQIRAQFSAIGHPIVGDAKYGSKTKRDRIALHHQKLELTHPARDEALRFLAEISF